MHQLGLNANSCILVMVGSNNRNFIQREVDRINNVVWQTLKCTHIVEEHEYDLDCNLDGDVFYTPPQNPNQIPNANQFLVGLPGPWLPLPLIYAKLMI